MRGIGNRRKIDNPLCQIGLSADLEKFLEDQKAIEDRRQALFANLMKQKETAIKNFDDRLAKLG